MPLIKSDDASQSSPRTEDAYDEVSRRRLLATAGAVGVAGAFGGLLAGGRADLAKAAACGEACVDVKDFGATGDGSTDDSSSIQEALDKAESTGGGAVSFPPGIYIATGLTVGENVGLIGSRGAVVKLKGSTTSPLISLVGNGASIADVVLDGNGANQTNSPHNFLVSIDGNDTKVINITFQNAKHVCIHVSEESTGSLITQCIFDGKTEITGVSNRNCVEMRGSFASVVANLFRDVENGHGVRVGLADADLPGPPVVEHVVVADNVFINIDSSSTNESPAMKAEATSRHIIFAANTIKGGQRPFKLDSCSDLIVIGNTMDGCSSTIGINAEGCPGLIFANNIMKNCGAGLIAASDTLIANNSFENIGTGVEAETTGAIRGHSTSHGLTIVGNRMKDVSGRAIQAYGSYVRVLDNYIGGGTMASGIPVVRAGASSAVGCEVRGNVITDPGSAGGSSKGIEALGDRLRIQANTISASETLSRGIAVHNSNDVLVKDNIVNDATTAIYQSGIGSAAVFVDNVGATQPAVAAASTITLPGYPVVTITGASTINNINPGPAGSVVTLVLSAAATVTDGGNLRLQSSFTASASDTLTIACDGTNWFEVSRSVN